jgi:HSP20 family protein
MDAIIVRRNPRALGLVEPVDVFQDVERFANDMWDNWTPVYHEQRSSIPMEMFELKDDLVIRAEMPGIKKENIDVSLEGDELTLKATKKEEARPEGTESYLCELGFGEYTRTVTLPFPVSSEKTTATFENGMLEIRLPKTEESKPKHIEVRIK